MRTVMTYYAGITAKCTVGPAGKPCDGKESGQCTGEITLTQLDAATCKIEYDLKGGKPGHHGFHIHEKADFSDALLVVDMCQANLADLGDDELPWACAATLVSELGFPCYVSRTRYVQAFWPDED